MLRILVGSSQLCGSSILVNLCGVASPPSRQFWFGRFFKRLARTFVSLLPAFVQRFNLGSATRACRTFPLADAPPLPCAALACRGRRGVRSAAVSRRRARHEKRSRLTGTPASDLATSFRGTLPAAAQQQAALCLLPRACTQQQHYTYAPNRPSPMPARTRLLLPFSAPACHTHTPYQRVAYHACLPAC